jgi:two-component system nitrogen regulation response regulator GlnG
MPKLLVVDDEPMICQSFQWVIGTHDVEVLTAGSVREGWERIEADRPEVIVLDYQLPDGSGLDLFDRLEAIEPRPSVIFLTAHGSSETAMEAMKRGAFDYIDKPFELDHMDALLKRAFDAARFIREPAAPDLFKPNRIVGRTPIIRDVCKQIGRVAPLDATVLILGESGTGKELIARAIHQHSRRSNKPFLAINCAAIPEGLVESELFGNEPGAFTGAIGRRIGRFEQADEGSVFLDEVGDMPLPIQAKVLRFLQDRTFERVGGGTQITARVRVIAATNQCLEQLIAEGRFRNDLYYRLNEVTLRAPALRERIDDIAELAQYFLLQFVHETGRDIQGIDSQVLERFRRYPWPGNVRELRGVIKEAALKSTGRIIVSDFLPSSLADREARLALSTPDKKTPSFDILSKIDSMLSAGENEIYDRVISMIEYELITLVLRHTRGHLGQTCERLGIDRKTLRNKLNALNIRPDQAAPELADQ